MQPPTADFSVRTPTPTSPQGVSLEPPALLPGTLGSWGLNLWAEAGEATAWYVPPPEPSPTIVIPNFPSRTAEQLAHDAAMRAKGEVRRYCRANGLRYLWTLTNRDVVTDYAEMARRVERFMERIRAAGWNIPLVVVPEPHPYGHGWHVHVGADRFLPIKQMRACWSYGIVDVRGPGGRARGEWRSRKLATYLSKYIAKSLELDELAGCSPRPKGAHRYWKTQGFEPQPVTLHFRTLASLMECLKRWYGVPDAILPFGQGDAFRPEGYWLSFPDKCLRAPPWYLLNTHPAPR